MTADAAHEPPERDDLLHVDDVLEVRRGAVQRHLLDRLGGLARVLHWDVQVRKPTARGLRGRRETRLTRKMSEGCGPTRKREPPNSRKVRHFLLFSELDFLSGDTEGSRLG